MKTKIGLLSVAIAIAVLVLGPGSALADDLAPGNIRHAPSLGQRFRDSLFPGLPRPSDTPFISYFNTEQQQRYAFAEEQEKAADASRAGPGAIDSWNTSKPVGNVFKFNF
jgi:hypothetical protein